MIPPLTWAALAFLAGLVFAEVTDTSLSVGLIGLACVFTLGVVLARIKKPSIGSVIIRKNNRAGIAPVILILSFLSGVVRLQISSLPISANNLAWYNDKGTVTIKGVICGYPDSRDTFQLVTIYSETIEFGTNEMETIPISGKAIVRTGTGVTWRYGDEIHLIGKLSTPANEADFSYQDYLAHKSILSSLYYPDIVLIDHNRGNPLLSWIYSIRSQAIATLSQIFPAPESALLAGILLGYDNDIPPDIQTAFRKTGTTHIIAISGFNISILAALFSALYYRLLGIRKGILATIITLIVYVLLTGASPSVVRAAIMGSLGLLASLVGRRQNGINSLAFVGTIMCLFNPFLPWDISFQLSFLSTLGLILFADRMVEWIKRFLVKLLPLHVMENTAEKIGEYFLFTLAALVMTFPVMAYHFHTFSWLAFLSNPLILPAQPAVMILGGIALLLGMVWLPLGQIIGYLAWPFVAYTIKLVTLIGNIPGDASGGIQLGMGFIAFYYALLILIFIKNKGSLIRRALQPNLIILLSGALIVTLWRIGLSQPDGLLHIYVLDNGPSENILIRSPGGRNLLINAGSQSGILADALGKRMPPDSRQLDMVFLPVDDKQAIRSIRHGSSGISINKLIWLGDPTGQATAIELEEYISVVNITHTIGISKLEFYLASDASLVLYPYQDNGGVFSLQWKNFNMLIPIGIDRADWTNEILEVDHRLSYSVIVLAGDGSIELNPVPFINRLTPTITIVNSDPERSSSAIPMFYHSGTTLTTGQNGWIHITTDGDHLWVEAARNPE
ncbi:MAG: ComEC/Rec2 family competence protein [Anaerolineaceae bacterium]